MFPAIICSNFFLLPLPFFLDSKCIYVRPLDVVYRLRLYLTPLLVLLYLLELFPANLTSCSLILSFDVKWNSFILWIFSISNCFFFFAFCFLMETPSIAAIQLYHWILTVLLMIALKFCLITTSGPFPWSLLLTVFSVRYYFFFLSSRHISGVCVIYHICILAGGVLGVLVSPAAAKKSDKKPLDPGDFASSTTSSGMKVAQAPLSQASCLFTLKLAHLGFCSPPPSFFLKLG